MRRSDIESDVEKNLKEYSFSGPYVYYSNEDDENTILLRRNRYYSYEGLIQYYDQIRFGFGEDALQVQKHIDADILLSDAIIDKK
jgi:hypothetical protein